MSLRNELRDAKDIKEIRLLFEKNDIQCAIGTNGGRHFVKNITEPQDYITLNQITKRVNELKDATFDGSFDSSDILFLRKCIMDLNTLGETTLSQSSTWKKAGTTFKRINNLGTNRLKILDEALQKVGVAEHKFLEDIKKEIDKEIQNTINPEDFSDSLKEKLRAIRSVSLYQEILKHSITKQMTHPDVLAKVYDSLNSLKDYPIHDEIKNEMQTPIADLQISCLTSNFIKYLFDESKVITLSNLVQYDRYPLPTLETFKLEIDLNKFPIAFWHASDKMRHKFALEFQDQIMLLKGELGPSNPRRLGKIEIKGLVEFGNLSEEKRNVYEETIHDTLLPLVRKDKIERLFSHWKHPEACEAQFDHPALIKRALMLISHTMGALETNQFGHLQNMKLLADFWIESGLLSSTVCEKLQNEVHQLEPPAQLKDFLKKELPNYHQQELLLKEVLFKKFCQECPEGTDDPVILAWMREVIVDLAESIDKLKNKPEVDQAVLEALTSVIKEEKAKIDKFTKDISRLGIPAPKVLIVNNHIDKFRVNQSGLRSRTALHKNPSTPLKIDEKVEELAIAPRPLTPTFLSHQYLESSDLSNLKNFEALTDRWLGHVDQLLGERQLELAERALLTYLNRFESAETRHKFVEMVPEAEILKWLERLEKISNLLVSTSYRMARPAFPHTSITPLLRNFEMMQLLLSRNPDAQFEKYSFSMRYLEQGLKNPYLDLGTQAPEIKELLRNIEKKGMPQDFSHPGVFQTRDTFEGARNIHYYGEFGPKNFYREKDTEVPPDFFVTQKAYLMLHMVLMPNTVLFDKLSPETLESGFLTLANYQADQSSVRQKLTQEKSFEFEIDPEKPYFHIKSHGIYFSSPRLIDYLQDRLNKHKIEEAPNCFEKQRHAVKEAKIRTRIATAEVGVGSDVKEGKTQFSPDFIQNEPLHEGLFESCSPALSKELELMQTLPDDRVRNTIELFTAHSSLLRNPDWQRVMELNLFHDGFLYQKLEKDPEYIKELTFHLELLTNKIQAQPDLTAFLTLLLARTHSLVSQIQQKQPFNPSLKPQIEILSNLVKKLERQLNAQLLQAEQNFTQDSPDYENTCSRWLETVAISGTLPGEPDLLRFFKRYMWLIALPRTDAREDVRALVINFADRHLDALGHILKKYPEYMRELLSLRQRLSPIEVATCIDAKGLQWETEQYRIDIKTGEISDKQTSEEMLPLHVLKALGLLLPTALQTQKMKMTKTTDSQTTLTTTQFKSNEQIVEVTFSNKGDVIIQRMRADGEWEKKSMAIPKTGVPYLDQFTPWICESDKSICYYNKQSVLIAKGNWDPQAKTLTAIKMLQFTEPNNLLLPQQKKPLQIFEVFGSDFIILGNQNPDQSVDAQNFIPKKIIYPDQGYEYTWNQHAHGWESNVRSGYYLSDAEMQNILQPLVKEDPAQIFVSANQLFSSGFRDYHIVDNGKQKLLVLNPREYTPHLSEESSAATLKLRKHTRQRFIVKEASSLPLYHFEIDPEKGLLAKEPEAHLYLAYLYIVQGKYPQASLALQQAFQRMQGLTPDALKLISMIERWPAKAPNFIALKAKLTLNIVEQELMEQMDQGKATQLDKKLHTHLQKYQDYLEKEKDVDLQVRLSQTEKEKFKFLGRRSQEWVKGWLLPSLEPHGISQLKSGSTKASSLEEWITSHTTLSDNAKTQLSKELPLLLENSFLDFRDFIFYLEGGLLEEQNVEKKFKDDQSILCWGLDREIEIRSQALPEVNVEPSFSAPISKPTPLFAESTSFLCAKEPSIELINKLNYHLDQLQKAFQYEEGSFEKERADFFIKDVQHYCASINLPLVPQDPAGEASLTNVKDLAELEDWVIKQKKQFAETVATLRTEIVREFSLGPQAFSLGREMREEDPVVEDLFQRGRWSFGEQDWHSLIDQGVIFESQQKDLSSKYADFLKAHRLLLQQQKIEAQLAVFKASRGTSSAIEAESKLVQLLTQKQLFDETHPLAPSLLLIEDELGIIGSESQLQHICNLITQRSAFCQAAWGEGKTSFLRVVIAKVHANGGYVSGLLTLAPLIEEHHAQFKEDTAANYGQQSYKIEYNRDSPIDGIACRRELLKLVKIAQERGRTDQTLASFIRQRQLHNLAVRNFSEDPKNPKVALEAFDAIQAFNKLLNFQQKRMILGSDELDQLFTPEKQYDFALGEAERVLDEDVYEPALDLLSLLSSPAYQDYHSYFTQDNQNPLLLTTEQRSHLLNKLALDLRKKYGIKHLSESEIALYWSPSPNPMPEERYNQLQAIHAKVKAGPQKDKIYSLRVYFESILEKSFDSRYGINYLRDRNGIHTKPPAEKRNPDDKDETMYAEPKAEFGSKFTMCWFTCLDFFRNGLLPKASTRALNAYIGQLRNQNDGEKHFSELFGRHGFNLDEITEKDYPALAALINASPALKIDFIRVANFSAATFSDKSLVGNGKQVAYDVAEIYGSSGNAERMGTLPRKIATNAQSIQPGTMGRIFYNFVKDYEPGDEKYYDPSKEPLDEFLASFWKDEGSAFIDVASSFQGMHPAQIADSILANSQDDTPIRYIDNKGEARLRLKDGKDQPYLGQECKTLFSYDDRRGRHLILKDKRENWMSVAGDTTFTSFSQGGMRCRKWGQGQKVTPIVDPSLARRLEQSERKDLSFPAKLMATLLENDSDFIKQLHTRSSQEEIEAVVSSRLQFALRHVSDLQSFREVKALSNDLLAKKMPTDLEQLSTPKKSQSTRSELQTMVEEKKVVLEELKKRIQACHFSSNESKKAVLDYFDVGLNILDSSSFLKEQKYYLATIPSAQNHQSVEVVEREVAQKETLLQVEQEIVAEVAREQELESTSLETLSAGVDREDDTDYEKSVAEPRPGRTIYLWPHEIEPFQSFNSIYDYTSPFDFQPGFHVTTQALASPLPYNPHISPKNEGLWVSGTTEKKQLLAPSVLLVYNNYYKKVESVMGNPKDADTVFEKEPTSKSLFAKENLLIHYKFGDLRLLNEILAPIPDPKKRQEALEHIVLAKLLYGGNVQWSPEEIVVGRKVLKDNPQLAPQLKKYVRDFFPPSERGTLHHLGLR